MKEHYNLLAKDKQLLPMEYIRTPKENNVKFKELNKKLGYMTPKHPDYATTVAEIAKINETSINLRNDNKKLLAVRKTMQAQDRGRLQQLQAGESARLQGLSAQEASRLAQLQAGEAARLGELTAGSQMQLNQQEAAEASRLAQLVATGQMNLDQLSAQEASNIAQLQAAESSRLQGLTLGEQSRLDQLMASGQFQVDMLDRQGQMYVQQQNFNRIQSMYGLSASNLAASTQATNYANYQSGQDAGDLLSAFGSAYGLFSQVGMIHSYNLDRMGS